MSKSRQYPFPIGIIPNPLQNSPMQNDIENPTPAPGPAMYITTESGELIITEDGKFLVTEGA